MILVVIVQIKKNKPPIKTIYSFSYKETKTHYIFMIHGNNFLRYMVRIIMKCDCLGLNKNQKPLLPRNKKIFQ